MRWQPLLVFAATAVSAFKTQDIAWRLPLLPKTPLPQMEHTLDKPLDLRIESFHPFTGEALTDAWENADEVSILQRDVVDIVTGDLKALAANYGMPGASGKHCIFCLVKATARAQYWPDIKDDIVRRTLGSIDADYVKFCAGGSKKPVNGVQAQRMANTFLDNVARAPLHAVTLGPPADLYVRLRREAEEYDELDEAAKAAVEAYNLQKDLVKTLEDEVEEMKTQKILAERDLENAKKELDGWQTKHAALASGNIQKKSAVAGGCSSDLFDKFDAARNLKREAESEAKTARENLKGKEAEVKTAKRERDKAETAVLKVKKRSSTALSGPSIR